MTRRELLKLGGLAALARFEIPLALASPPKKGFKLAVITDIHHGLAPDAMSRLDAFVAAVHKRKDTDLILQLGDFCYSDEGSTEFLHKFQTLTRDYSRGRGLNRPPGPRLPVIHVLGNHDMDKCDKYAAMKFWGMKGRYGTHEMPDFTFVWLDLNHFKKNGKLVDYDRGNYFTDNATHNWADPAQLDWLHKTLQRANKPVILLSHQPLGFAEPGQPLPPEQQEVLEVLARNKGKVVLSMFGHLHVDRLEHVGGVPFYCVNSASYFWSGGMWPYSKPLFAFMELTTDGRLIVEGISGEFTKPPPTASNTVIGRSPSIRSRTQRI